MFVAQNDPVKIGIYGSEVIAKKDVGGYILVPREDWVGMVQALKACKAATPPAR